MKTSNIATTKGSALPLFRFDTDELHKLQDALPADLQFLRLRLRFGLPVRVQVGQRFRVVVDLVDEMGQPTPEHPTLPGAVDFSTTCQRSATVDSNKSKSIPLDDDQLVLKLEEKVNTNQRRTKWVYWASLHGSAASKDVNVSLRIQMEQTYCDSSSSGAYRRLLQTFCTGSAWLSDRVLVLSLQVQLQVESTSEVSHPVASSTTCQRLFRTTSTTAEDDSSSLIIEENYGDAMGSHIWDASIMLSFAVLQTGITASNQEITMDTTEMKQSLLELGSGCGLFATVLATYLPRSAKLTAIFTEKSECTERLQTNLDRNGSSSYASVVSLDWGATLPSGLGSAGVRVVFAADVLYNWAAHEALLVTLDTLEQHSPTRIEVFLAHKRRGKASAAKLDALASGTFHSSTHCGIATDPSACRWIHWHVKKLASVGRVDFFRLSYDADKVATQQ